MTQITINIQTLDWTMGETVGLHLMLKKGSKARIAWGDGKVQVVTGKQKPASEKLAWVEAGHAYPEKGIIIGHQGVALKKMSTEARKSLEKFFGKSVYLHTFVKVDKDWRSSKRELDNFGYNPE